MTRTARGLSRGTVTQWWRVWAIVVLSGVGAGDECRAQSPRPDHTKVPGVVINHSPASSGRYIGSPSLAILPDGRYVASHDFFGPRSGEGNSGVTLVFASSDRGKSWRKVAKVTPLFWAKLFVHRGDLYALGTTRGCSDLTIRRSRDGGQTWTTPGGPATGLLAKGLYHCAPCPVLVHGGRIWRSVEENSPSLLRRRDFRAMVLSAPVDADLLNAASWTLTAPLVPDYTWLDGRFREWLEGNVALTPDGQVVNILRVDTPEGGRAAMVRISKDGRAASFDPARDFIRFPGGAKKFAIHYDPATRRYWSLANYVRPRDAGKTRAASICNTLALTSSPDLRTWTVHEVILEHPDVAKVAFQYVDWEFDGPDIAAVSRTAYDDGLGGARRAHDANYLTFHRIKAFREKASRTLQAAE